MTTVRERHEIVAAEVRAQLARAGLRQRHLAEHLGISQGAASELVHGKVPFSLNRLDEIARWLEIRLSDLLGDQNPEPRGIERRVRTGWRTRRPLIRHTRPVVTQLLRAA
jgi:transcriptional regulator with XRE-family HTH domain